MILISGKYCGSHKYANCNRERECIFCHACENYDTGRTKCLRCYPTTLQILLGDPKAKGAPFCRCSPELKQRVYETQKLMKQASWSPNPKQKNPRGLVEMSEMLRRVQRRQSKGVGEYKAGEIK